MINHPLITVLREKLNISYNFYVEGVDDLGKLLRARKFYPDKDNNSPLGDDLKWERKAKDGGKELLVISKSIFDDENNLKYFNATKWQESFVSLKNIPAPTDDDLPF